MSTKNIIISDYNPKWVLHFENLRYVLQDRLGNLILNIEHVGSTAVPGLKAKPIIDIDIIIKKDEKIRTAVINELNELGYNHVGDYGVPGREAFKRKSDATPKSDVIKSWPDHHLYVCENGCTSLNNHLLLRDFLRENPDKVVEYGSLKSKLAEKYTNDIDNYVAGKTSFIVNILRIQGMKETEIQSITDLNEAS